MRRLALQRRREAVLLLTAALLLSGHYTFGEWVWHPGIKLRVQGAFWAGVPWYALFPPLLWGGWWVLSLGRMRIGLLLLKLAACICVGDMLWGLTAHNLNVFGINLPVEYWPTWTYWMPAVLLFGNLIALRRWWMLVRRAWLANASWPADTVRPSRRTTNDENERQFQGRPACLLRVAATLLGSVAVLATAVHLIPPRMPVSGFTLELAGEFLVSARLQDDFAFITQQAVWRGKRLGALLDHVELSDLQRRQFYPNLDSYIFQTCVLSPNIDQLPLSELDWRRPFWEHFYPRVRGEHDPLAGAQVIVRCLRERVGISSEYPYRVGVETIWIQGMTDMAGFERIYVAALRSVGIAAQLGAQGQAEVWTGAVWQVAPRPLSLATEKTEGAGRKVDKDIRL